jgi:hypothetical protein
MSDPIGAPPGSPAPAGPDAPDRPRRRGGPPVLFAALGIGSLVLGVLIIAAQALGLGGAGVAPATMPPTGAAAQLARDLVVKALQGAAFEVQDPTTAYRPGESPALFLVPRRLLQVVLAQEPQGGYVVIYELPSAGEADRVGRDFAAYLASGTGAIQYPADTRFVIRRQGSALVFFAWSPAADVDPGVPTVAAVLETVGVPLTGS